jgi:predicted AAA+ superfamily ATPase
VLLDDARLDEVLRAQNPWWTSGAMPARARHTQARAPDAFLRETGRPALVAGPRRCGKTSTLFRLADAHLRGGAGPREVAYLPLDHALLRLVPLGLLVDRAVRLMEPRGRPLFLVDSVQALPQWPERFLELVKTRPHPRFVGAASVSPGVADPVAFDTVHLGPLSFREFCALKGLPDLGAPPLDLGDPRLPDRTDPREDFLFHRVLDPMLADYLVRGGFFETALAPDPAQAHELVRQEVVARAVYQDLPAVVNVDKVGELERVLLAALLQGGLVVREALADVLEIDPSTVSRYLDLLARAFLLLELRNFAGVVDRSRVRLFPVDPALPNALFERGAAVLARPEERRSLLAGALVAHLQRAARERGFDLAYFREGDLEADAVLVGPEGAIPVLLVDREEAGEEEAAQAAKVLKRTQASNAFVLSRAGPRVRAPVTFFESVYHLPASYFLYALAGTA